MLFKCVREYTCIWRTFNFELTVFIFLFLLFGTVFSKQSNDIDQHRSIFLYNGFLVWQQQFCSAKKTNILKQHQLIFLYGTGSITENGSLRQRPVRYFQNGLPNRSQKIRTVRQACVRAVFCFLRFFSYVLFASIQFCACFVRTVFPKKSVFTAPFLSCSVKTALSGFYVISWV